MSWLDKYFNTGVTTVQIAGVALPPERILNFASGVTGADNPTLGRTDLTVSGGGGGGSGGPTSYGALTANTAFTRPSNGWLTASGDTKTPNAPVTGTAWSSAQVDDKIELADDAYFTQTEGLTFNGNGIPVVPPDQQIPTFAAGSYTYRFDGERHTWRCCKVASLNSNNPFWKAD